MKGDKLKGGKADKLNPEDFDPEQLRIGTEHEKEHTKDEKVAQEIAMDHLAEDPDYYTKVAKIEGKKKPTEQVDDSLIELSLKKSEDVIRITHTGVERGGIFANKQGEEPKP